MAAGKIKLRTAGDVISRLRWSEEEDPARVLMGYDDRIKGPMEKSIAAYKSIDDGGDIPQHRIQYFRRAAKEGQGINMNQLILWDREGRVDRLFGSGLGGTAPASKCTIKLAFDAIANMKRIAEEKEVIRQEKAKQRARRQRKAQARIRAENAALTNQASNATDESNVAAEKRDRFVWEKVDWFDFSSTEVEWRKGAARNTPASKGRGPRRLHFVTWNILFDKYEAQTALFEGDNALDRWRLAIRLLGEVDADLIALQEVTPRFVSLLCESSWVQREYSVSAVPSDTSSIDPYGNLFLWKRTSLRPVSHSLGLTMLVDGPRKRSIVACLQQIQSPETVLVCACVHLPCDATTYGENPERQSRAAARRRELNTVVGKLQALEAQLQCASTKSTVPVLMGDFNSDERNRELEDGGFMASSATGSNALCGVFSDVWPIVSNGSEGYTYHPGRNRRASFSVKGPRRIDRICVGRGAAEPVLPIQPIDGGLIGADLPSREEFPPSDHYGLSVLFDTQANATQSQCNQRLLQQSAWARTALPTTDTLLALTLRDSPSENTKLFDPNSSLPVPHITLLNGFTELQCQESRDLAMQTVANAVEQTLATGQSFAVPFSRDSLTVFEHRSSATLVCTPDGACPWLETLYQTLRGSFRFCDEQESRFLEGWSPHVSLGKFGSESEARQQANRLTSGGSWFQERCFLPAQAVVMYQRDPNDRKFYAIASVPLGKATKNIQTCDPKEFLGDAGASLSSFFSNQSAPFVSSIERVCLASTERLSDGHLEAKLKIYGSCQLHASLPNISDIDAVVELSPREGSPNGQALHNFSPSAFLQTVGAELKSIHSNAKIRMRIASTNGVVLYFLTAKLTPQAPSVDLMVCLRNSDGECTDAMGASASSSIEDGQLILRELRSEAPQMLPGPRDIVKVFEGALRLCKIWAHRRQIYGAQLGYLGGGGWALLIARTMSEGLRDGSLRLDHDLVEPGTASMKVLSYFFRQMTLSWNQGIFALNGTQFCDEAKEQTLSRGTLSVIAPASGGDFGRNTTRSTAAAMLKEIQRAYAILKNCSGGGAGGLFVPMKQEEFLSEGSSVLFLQVAAAKLARHDGGPCLPEVKAWAARQLLQTLVSLESEIGDADLVRSFSRPVRIKGKLLYIVRVAKTAGHLDGFVRKRVRSLQPEASEFLKQQPGDEENSMVRLCCLTATRFCQAFG